ncbi:MAG: restriction endonuclease subunit S, partial [Fibrobacter sp.]|nr:restriction endonuclease subunit S [Fibrobacter sp.]
MSWEKVKLGDIAASVQTGPFGSQLHQSDYSEFGTPVVMPKDMIGGKILEDSIARVEEQHVNRLSRHKVNVGDILYARRGDVGKCALVTENEKGWLCGTGCLKVTIDFSKANPKFVFYQLQKPETVGWVEKHAVGATMLNLNTGILESIPIELPKLNEQNKIVDILSAYDDLIENNQKQIKLLEEAAQRLYKQWFIDLRYPGHETTKIVDGLPEGWRKEKLVDLATVQFGYAFDGSLFNSNGNGTPIVRIRNIPDGFTNDYTTENAPEEYIINNGDIVVGMDGEFHINSWSG